MKKVNKIWSIIKQKIHIYSNIDIVNLIIHVLFIIYEIAHHGTFYEDIKRTWYILLLCYIIYMFLYFVSIKMENKHKILALEITNLLQKEVKGEELQKAIQYLQDTIHKINDSNNTLIHVGTVIIDMYVLGILLMRTF